jgi:hypothetical protein
LIGKEVSCGLETVSYIEITVSLLLFIQMVESGGVKMGALLDTNTKARTKIIVLKVRLEKPVELFRLSTGESFMKNGRLYYIDYRDQFAQKVFTKDDKSDHFSPPYTMFEFEKVAPVKSWIYLDDPYHGWKRVKRNKQT